MPFPKWSVEPVFLSRKPIPPDKKKELCDFETTTNLTFVNCLRQLASVAKIADRIFVEIACECRLLGERSERLKEKIRSCQNAVDNLDARAVKVPLSNLNETAKRLRLEKPYATRYEQTTQLFLPSTRPPCVDTLYGGACTSPVSIMCTIDQYRTDGLSASELFMVTPVLGGTRKKRRKLLDIETRKPANFSLVKTKQDRIQSGSASLPPLVSPSVGYRLKQNENLELERLPSPEEQAMLVSLEYPSTVVSVDTSGTSFTRMSLLRRSLMHADFVIKRKKSKKKSKRRHTFCEGDNRELEKALRNVTNTSCQTDDMLDITSDSSSNTLVRRPSFLTKRRSRSVQDNLRQKANLEDDLDSLKHLDSKDSATEDDKEKTPTKSNTATVKKSKSSSLRSRAYNFNPISSLSAAISIAAVKMRNSSRTNKQDDGRSSSGNWSASSSTRASVDSDHHQATSPVDGISSPSRNSVGKDSVLSDATHQDPHNRSRDDILPIQSLTCSPVKQRRYQGGWDANNGRISNTPTPDFTSQCSSSTPLVRSPYTGRRGISDDGDSSVYSVDTDGYYTSMHTDSGLWTNAIPILKAEDVMEEVVGIRHRQESQSSVSTIDNSSINSFLSKSATECSSNSGSLKRDSNEKIPLCSTVLKEESDSNKALTKAEQDTEDSDKSYSPHPPNGSASESDQEVGDRIRAKTSITANRYPSMCAVSPETSDDEIAEMRRKRLLPNVNVIVAEVHREDNNSYKTDSQNSKDKSTLQFCRNNFFSHAPDSSSINMYRSDTPLPSSFSSSISQSQPVSASTPRSGMSITTFSSDMNETINPHTKAHNYRTKNSQSNPSKNFTNGEDVVVTEKPTSPIMKNKSLIPLKYAQRITVTPIARKDPSGDVLKTMGRPPLLKYPTSDKNEKLSAINLNKADGISSYVSYKSPDSPLSSVGVTPVNSPKHAPSPTNPLSRPVARVTLDPTGNVVYSSNSLERPSSSRSTKNDTPPSTYATLPKYQANNVTNKSAELQKELPFLTKVPGDISQSDGCDTHSSPDKFQTALAPTPQCGQNPSFSSFRPNNMSNDFTFRPSRGGRFCRSYFPSHLISANSSRGGHQPTSFRTSYTSPTTAVIKEGNSSSILTYVSSENAAGQNQPSSEESIHKQQMSSSYIPKIPNSSSSHLVPNAQRSENIPSQPLSVTKSGIWPGRSHFSTLGELNHQKRLSPEITQSSTVKPSYSSFASLSPPDLIPSGESPPSTLDITNSSKQMVFQPHKTFVSPTKENLKSLSANELFAIIHNSKKKHNIKTDSEISMSPMSSRSVSPALSQSSVSRLQPVETGVLSRRADNGLNSIDKSKWCNSMPSPTPKRLTVQEKLATKPTSMHDFKMLLLQTRSGTPNGNSRTSAAELLKVSPPRNSPGLSNVSPKTPLPSTFKSPIAHYNSSVNYSPGHGTVPTKRTRTRSPYLTRYDSAYPPIIEDCSEETECYENSKCLKFSQQPYNRAALTINHDLITKPPVAKATSTWV